MTPPLPSCIADLLTGDSDRRLIITGGPRRGKSWISRALREEHGIPTLCGDPEDKVKDQESGVLYLPPGTGWSEGSKWIAEKWLTAPGPWCCEGVALPRALRKLLAAGGAELLEGVPVIYIMNAAPGAKTTEGQERMVKAVATVLGEIWKAIPHGVICQWAGKELRAVGRLRVKKPLDLGVGSG